LQGKQAVCHVVAPSLVEAVCVWLSLDAKNIR